MNIQKNKILSVLLSLLSFVPIFVFMFYARIKGIVNTCDASWQDPFYSAALLAFLTMGIQLYAGLMLDRLMLGANFFLIVAAAVFLFDAQPCLSILGAHKGPFFIGCVLAIGIITTFTTDAGFIGIESSNKQKIRTLSISLLYSTIAAFGWSILASSKGLLASGIVPFIVLRFVAQNLIKQIKS